MGGRLLGLDQNHVRFLHEGPVPANLKLQLAALRVIDLAVGYVIRLYVTLGGLHRGKRVEIVRFPDEDWWLHALSVRFANRFVKPSARSA